MIDMVIALGEKETRADILEESARYLGIGALALTTVLIALM